MEFRNGVKPNGQPAWNGYAIYEPSPEPQPTHSLWQYGTRILQYVCAWPIRPSILGRLISPSVRTDLGPPFLKHPKDRHVLGGRLGPRWGLCSSSSRYQPKSEEELDPCALYRPEKFHPARAICHP